MYRRKFIYIFLLIFITSGLWSQVTITFDAPQTVESEKDAILVVMQMQEEAWNKYDLEAFMEGYWKSDSLRFIGSRGITYGWNQTLENYKKGYPDKEAMGTLNFDILHLDRISSDAYFMVGKYTLIRKEDKPTGYFNLLWRKIGERWVIVSDMTVNSKY